MQNFKRLEEVKQAKLEEERLLKLRERLEIEITQLERAGGSETLLEKCTQEKRALDHRLDELEELTCHSPAQIREELLKGLQERKEGEKILQEINQFQDLENRLTAAGVEGALLESHLNALIENRERVKKRSVLSYIFGTNPNAAIQIALREGAESAKKLEEEIPPLLSHSATRAQFASDLKRLQTLLKKLIDESSSGWSFPKIDETFTPFRSELAELIQLISDEKSALKAQRLAEEAQFDRWISSLVQLNKSY